MDNGLTPQLVVSRLAGGLGNQIFQFAAGHALASRLGVPLQLDHSMLQTRTGDPEVTPRSYALDVFSLNVPEADQRTIEALAPGHQGILNRVLARLRSGTQGHVLVEQSKTFNHEFLQVKAPVYLIGHWQNERYFETVADELRDQLLIPRQAPSDRNLELLEQCSKRITASIHVRRGDYVHDKAALAYHGLLPTNYYQAAAQALIQRHGVEHVLVFSDDPAWVRVNLRLPCPSTVVEHNAGNESHWDLWLMKQCAHNIIANSSFSWWGAWLGDPSGRSVIAPRNWFADATIQHEILPVTWLAR